MAKFFHCLVVVSACVNFCTAQDQEEMVKLVRRDVAISLVPGVGTSGLDFESLSTKISINLIAGYSASSNGFELGVFSNYNKFSANGIQMAGLFNVVGKKRINLTSRRPDFFGTLNGFQVAGIANKVFSSGAGFQLGGLFNLVNKSFDGAQVAGFLNRTNDVLAGVQISGGINFCGEFALGVQVAGLMNSSVKSFDGLQFSPAINFTAGSLTGYQLGSINRAAMVNGKASTEAYNFNSLQIGLINSAGKLSGVQVGLINRAKEHNGVQVGLLNFCGKNRGRSYGLLNINSMGEHVRFYFSESFPYNLEISTGSRKIMSAQTLQNNILFSYDPTPTHRRYAYGYGVGKVIYSIDPERDQKFFHYDVQVSYETQDLKIDGSGRIVGKLRSFIGRRLFSQKPYYVFVGLSLNYAHQHADYSADLPRFRVTINKNSILWPGFYVGMQLH
jgi:hypothetical protein